MVAIFYSGAPVYISIHKSGKNKKNVYVQLVEAYTAPDGTKRNRLVKSFGRLEDVTKDDPQAVEKLKAQYSEQRIAKRKATAEARMENVKQILAISNKPKVGSSQMPILYYGHYLLQRIWDDDLGLSAKIDYLQKRSGSRVKFKYNAVARHMACLKVMDPNSILFTYGNKDDFVGDPLCDVSLDNCYETLSFLKEHKDSLFRSINKKMDQLVGSNRATMVFYDVTNVYFETPLTDAERDYQQTDFGERVQAAAERLKAEGIVGDDCFDEDGFVIPENLPASFWDEDANDRLQYLRMRGPSKEHRTDLPLVSVALVIDQYANPMDFEIYAGNASEFKTMKPTIKRLKEKYNIENAVVVADRGLNSVKNLQMLQELDLGFLVAQKVTNLGAELTAKMFDMSRYTDFNPTDPESGKFQVIPNWKKAGPDGKNVDCMLLLTFNEKRKNRDNRILDAMIDIVKKKAADGAKIGPRKSGWAALAKTDGDADCAVLGVDEVAVEKKRRFSGFAAVVYEDSPTTSDRLNPKEESNKPEVTGETAGVKDPATQATANASAPKDKVRMLSGRDVAAQYPRLNRIEDCFRVMKSHLGLRPMYVRTSDHIRGHITVCFLALLMLRLLQRRLELAKTPMSIKDICTTLRDASVVAMRPADQVMFMNAGRQANVRKGRERESTESLVQKIVEGKIVTTHIPAIMNACGLKELPTVCSLHELGAALRTRFSCIEEAIPAVRLVTI